MRPLIAAEEDARRPIVGKAIQSWKSRVRPDSPAPPTCQTPLPARIHSRRRQSTGPLLRSRRCPSQCRSGLRCPNAIEPKTRERFSLIVDEVKKYEGF
jgi:hypothetical protein